MIVCDEFARNKDRIIKESGRSLSGVLKRAKAAVWKYGPPKHGAKAAELLSDIDHKLDGAIDVTADTVARIEKLFAKTNWMGDVDAATRAASVRALQKKAPFHSGKNSFADSVIVELFGQLAAAARGRCVFVTHNVKDFSVSTGDQRKPHPDIAGHFSKINLATSSSWLMRCEPSGRTSSRRRCLSTSSR